MDFDSEPCCACRIRVQRTYGRTEGQGRTRREGSTSRPRVLARMTRHPRGARRDKGRSVVGLRDLGLRRRGPRTGCEDDPAISEASPRPVTTTHLCTLGNLVIRARGRRSRVIGSAAHFRVRARLAEVQRQRDRRGAGQAPTFGEIRRPRGFVLRAELNPPNRRSTSPLAHPLPMRCCRSINQAPTPSDEPSENCAAAEAYSWTSPQPGHLGDTQVVRIQPGAHRHQARGRPRHDAVGGPEGAKREQFAVHHTGDHRCRCGRGDHYLSQQVQALAGVGTRSTQRRLVGHEVRRRQQMQPRQHLQRGPRPRAHQVRQPVAVERLPHPQRSRKNRIGHPTIGRQPGGRRPRSPLTPALPAPTASVAVAGQPRRFAGCRCTVARASRAASAASRTPGNLTRWSSGSVTSADATGARARNARRTSRNL